jgi:hypothetical protein
MEGASSSGAGVQLAASGSCALCDSAPSEAERSLTVALLALVQQLTETNVHLLTLADQTAKALEHIAFLTDLMSMDDDEDNAHADRIYLDGTPIL